MVKPTPAQLERITKRGVAEIIIKSEFLERLQTGEPLRLKMGFDPSRPDLHLGHVVGLRKLHQLQELGHQVVLIVGDWTAQIGDPSGQSDTRTMLTANEVRANAETYMRQFFRIVDRERTEASYQSEWFGSFTLANVIELTSRFTVNQFLHREDFGRRYEAGQPLAITELLYPLLQAYDSVAIRSDVEFGGTDQLFNLLVGRELQEKMGQRPQQCFIMPILPGTDGVRRMGKSLGNYIAIEDPPSEMYGKIMSLPDSVLPTYFELLTDAPQEELTALNSAVSTGSAEVMDWKKQLGRKMVGWFHSAQAADKAQNEFQRVVQRGEAPADAPELAVTAATEGVVEASEDGVTVEVARLLVAAGLSKSRSEALRLLDQGAIELEGEPVTQNTVRMAYGSLLKVGRRRFVRVVMGA
jgi:tyrosyl-tRNA synthetase